MLEAVREWVSNSPSTRTMFRPLPTLFFTGLMILKEKKRNKTQPLVLSVEGALCVPDSEVCEGPHSALQKCQRIRRIMRAICFLLEMSSVLDSLRVSHCTFGPEQSARGTGRVPAWGWEVLGSGQPVSPGQEEGRVLHGWGPQGEPSCVPATQDPVLCILGKLSFSVSGQEVLSTDLSPSIQASRLCH